MSTVNPPLAGINFPFLLRNSIRVSTSILLAEQVKKRCCSPKFLDNGFSQ
ncbi:hypothetical protein BACUNI_00003 [Bacteroides uniformis ATCC 8492]|uniref:Uncharacterized protein n=1 Tax=Bacteroides uniformis (strain ATCC 8492 / DSM 6597 / CCUG 4942 / CIP 103695 / JCM 5828 / KCTC 5204 / NCTC 13054 / VPI 0061) TaxID=411479 RepID=A0ABC9NHX7_BACUC|nr:hypothetical protein BACUNI_00003 [Bacteroides uniformis ATCC 8492]